MYKNSVIIVLLIILTLTNSAYSDEFPLAIDSRIKTFIYSPNEVFTVKVNYGYQTFIEFSSSEAIKTIATGDAVSWNITPSGNRIFLKALEKTGQTNVSVITDKRSYIFDLVARDSNDELDRELTYVARFYYPETKSKKIQEDVSDLDNNQNEELHYSYKFYGDSKIKPIEIFDNGRVTFFKFKDKNTPKIFILKDDNVEYATKMMMWNGYIAIDGVHKNITLRHQEKFAKVTNYGTK